MKDVNKKCGHDPMQAVQTAGSLAKATHLTTTSSRPTTSRQIPRLRLLQQRWPRRCTGGMALWDAALGRSFGTQRTRGRTLTGRAVPGRFVRLSAAQHCEWVLLR